MWEAWPNGNVFVLLAKRCYFIGNETTGVMGRAIRGNA